MWTVSKVKSELPPVLVKIGRKSVTGRLSGRLNKFATVSVTNMGTLHSGSVIFADWSVAWETIVRCLNTGAAITV